MMYGDDWADEQDRMAEHHVFPWLDQDIDYPNDDWEDGYLDWDWAIRQGDPFPDLTEDDDAARWLAEHDV